MKYYDIYDMQTNEKIGQKFAWDIIDAEVKACIHLNKGSDDLYALTAENDEKENVDYDNKQKGETCRHCRLHKDI